MIRTCHPSIHSSIPPTMSPPHPNPPFTCLGVRRFSPPSPSPNPTPALGQSHPVGWGRRRGSEQVRTTQSFLDLPLSPTPPFSPGLLLPLATVQHSHPPRSKKGGDRQGVRSPPLTCFFIPTPYIHPSHPPCLLTFTLTLAPFTGCFFPVPFGG